MSLDYQRAVVLVKHPGFKAAFTRAFSRFVVHVTDGNNALDPDELLRLLIVEMETSAPWTGGSVT